MSTHSGPDISNDGLVFAYDMGNPQKSWIGRPTTNSVNAATTVLSRYNNPGFSGTVTNNGQTYKGMTIYELTFIPQNDTFFEYGITSFFTNIDKTFYCCQLRAYVN
jgi:hypothetical protein